VAGTAIGRALASLIAATVLCGSLLQAQEQPVPSYDGWVTDLAGMLTPSEEQSLEARMESYRRGSGNDIALLTVRSLGREPIEKFALRVGREWKLGAVGKNNGALLVVAKDDRALRIEVGRGLEGSLPDAICGRIIRDVMTPRFQRGDFAGGLREGVEALQRAAGGDYAALPAPSARRDSGGGNFFPGLFVAFIVISILMRLFFGRGRRGMGGSVWPWLLVANSMQNSSRGSFGGGSGGGGGGFSGFGGGGGFSGGGASGRW
jgi:uncharacterized protein